MENSNNNMQRSNNPVNNSGNNGINNSVNSSASRTVDRTGTNQPKYLPNHNINNTSMADSGKKSKGGKGRKSGKRRKSGKSGKRPNPGKQNKNTNALIMIVMLLIAIIVIGVLGIVLFSLFGGKKVQSVDSYYGEYEFASINGNFVNNGNYDVMYLGEPSLPVTFVQDYIDEYMFWEPDTNRVTVTTDSEVIKMKTDDLTYYVNEQPMEFTVSSYRDDTEAYIPKSILETLYPVTITLNEETGIIVVEDLSKEQNVAKIKGKTPVKYKADKESANCTVVKKGETVKVYNEVDKYTKIQTADGFVGYVPTKKLGDIEVQTPVQPEEPVEHNLKDEKIMLLWDQVTTTTAANNRALEPIPEGVNVLSPTFFSFDTEKNDGTIVSVASSSYVRHAHENDVEVWALITDNFSTTMNDTILRNADTRAYVIDQIIGYVRLYNLDGINIDFEAVPARNAEYFIQFLRELYPKMKAEGAVLSVDTYVPSEWSMYYNRKAIGESADYLCVMTYDEHTSQSATTGPVASKDFVDKGVSDSLLEVPKEQLIMGIPFYTRVWKVNASNPSDFTIKNYSMDQAYEFFRKNDAQITFDEKTGYNYAKFSVMENGVEYYYEAWLEEEESLRQKMEIYKKYDVQGVGIWKRGLEQSNSYSVIEEELE